MELSLFLCLTVLLPGAACTALGLGWLAGWEPRERTVIRLTALCHVLCMASALALGIGMLITGQHQVTAQLGAWFRVEHYRFPLTLMVDRLSLPLVTLSCILLGVVGAFSARYLHRDSGFHRFFLLLHLFGFGILLLFTAASFDLLIVGWELVGITSVLLIAFFQYRSAPVQNALRVFAIYRGGDVGLLTATVLMHNHAGTASFAELFPSAWPGGTSALTGSAATLIGFLLLVAAMGKAAQVPFSGWLPRAMEGPTPSSAIFYGALSVHGGAYLLLRAQPFLAESPFLSATVIGVGLLTALLGTMAGRAATDAKTSLAHASVTQLGLIFIEIGLGWNWLAVLHICGHAAIRTLEFLRAPSTLQDYQDLYAAAGGQLGKTGAYFELLLPGSVRNRLYRLALDRGHLDTVLDRFVIGSLLRVARALHRKEVKWTARIRPTERPELPASE